MAMDALRVLTIVDTLGNLKEVDLNSYHKYELRMGRNQETCEIVISDGIVSKDHGEFRLEEEAVYYRDNNSSNGTYIENYEKRRLLNKDSGYVAVADKTIFKIGALDQPDKMILLLYRETEAQVKWQKCLLETSVTTIGRSQENQIILKHPGVSKIHSRVEKCGTEIQLCDNHSTNGVMLNGSSISKPTILKEKDIIEILDYQLIFSGTCIYYCESVSGIYLKAVQVTKTVGGGSGKKQILREVNCEIKGNEFVAIIGGSGAGKSTLMNVISGFDTRFEGKVYCNGLDLIAQFQNLKNIIGYVPQEDIIYENLTLRKMLYYTAKLKMPEDIMSEEIESRIAEVLKMIDLEPHQHTYIRKLSGGQKKRASIAVELLAAPKLFFLDEPTSGLDPGTEKSLMQTLNRLAKEQHKTVVMVTHTTQSLHLCDKIIIMGPGGRLCFSGNVEQAKAFFETDDLVEVYNIIADEPVKWQQQFVRQGQAQTSGQMTEPNEIEMKRGHRSSWIRQWFILMRRYAELIMNDKIRLLVLLIQPLAIGSLLYLVADNKVFKIYESTKSMLFALSCAAIWIGLFNSIQEVCKERAIVKREYMANLKLSAYMMAKFAVQLALGIFQALILTTTVLKLVGVSRKGIMLDNFYWEILLTVWLTILAAITMGFMISSMVKIADKAMAIAPFALIVQLLFSGILFKLEKAGETISYFTISRWSVEGLGSIAKLNRLELKMQADFPMLEHEAEAFFKASLPHLLKTWGILIVIMFICIVISIAVLRNLSKDSR